MIRYIKYDTALRYIKDMRVCELAECGASKQRHTLSMSQQSKSSVAESASIGMMVRVCVSIGANCTEVF